MGLMGQQALTVDRNIDPFHRNLTGRGSLNALCVCVYVYVSMCAQVYLWSPSNQPLVCLVILLTESAFHYMTWLYCLH